MATTIDSRTIYQDANGTVGYELAYDLLSQSSANNQSTVRLYGILHVNMASVYWTRGSASVHTSGLQPIGTSYSRGDHVVISRDFNFTHDNNGNFSAYIGASLSTTFISADIGGTLNLPKINRYPILNSGMNFNDEENPTYNITSYNTFPIRVKLEAGGNTQLIIRDLPASTNGNYTLELTETERNTLRTLATSNTLDVTETVCAMSGNTELSASYKRYKMTIVNANPEFSNFTFADINSTTTTLTGNNQYCIRGYSNIQATISTTDKATAKKQATMTKYQFNCGTNSPVEVAYSDSANVTLTMNNVPIGTFDIYAIDSRQNSTKVTKLATRDIAYENITLNGLNSTIIRDDNNVGTHAILTLSGKMWVGNFGATNNAINSVVYSFKKTSDTEWVTGTTTITPTVDNNGNITFTGEIASNNPDYSWDLEASYNVKVVVSDKLSSATVNLILSSAIPTMSLDKNGVGIMCAYDNSLGGLLQVGGTVIDGGKILWTNQNPTSNFSGTTISLNSDDYDVYEIIYSSEATGTLNNTLKSTKSIKGYGTIMEITNPSGSTTPIRARNVTYDTDTSLIISNGYTNNVYPLSTDNSKCIPLYVIGYNTGLFN